MKTKWIAGVLAFAAFTGLMTGCAKEKTISTPAPAETNFPVTAPPPPQQDAQEQQTEVDNSKFDGEGGTFIITLHPEDAPLTCENFEKLVTAGSYDGASFHRIIDDFMAQGGDVSQLGISVESIKGEFLNNGVENNRKHVRGTVSMARTNDPDSASSQFFICYTDCDFLNGSYAAFGEVTEGMEVVDDFLKVERSIGGDGAQSSPTTPVYMKKVEMIEDDENGNHRVQVTMNSFLG